MSKAKEILNKISEGVPSWEPKLKKAVVNIRTVMKKYSEYGAGDTEAEEFAFYWLPKYAYEGKSWKEYGNILILLFWLKHEALNGGMAIIWL